MMHYHTAKKTADRVVELLAPHCTRIDIAGSIRRGKHMVKDIEIVCLAKKTFVQTDLLGGGVWQTDPGFTQVITSITEKRIKGNESGRYMQLALKGGAVLDLFMPQPNDYYRQLAIRTGSAEYAALIIAHGWKKKGWCGTADGLRLQSECTQTKQGTWRLIAGNPTLPPVWASEEEFFAWLDVPYEHPVKREIPKSINVYA